MNTIKSLAELVETREVRVLQPRKSLQLLPYAAGFDRAVIPLLTWSIIFTAVSFVRKLPCLRFWLSDSMWTKMLPHAEVLNNSQGFDMLLFSAKNNSKSKMATPPGRMWTLLLRRALRTVIMSAKADLFQDPDSAAGRETAARETQGSSVGTSAVQCVGQSGRAELPPQPEWLAQFKDNSSIIRVVDESMRKFEGYPKDVSVSSATADSVSEGSRARPRKRKKTCSMEIDADEETRHYVVKLIRSMWLEKMNNGRTSARAYLYKSFVFILDKISQFKDVDRASQRGYKIYLHKEKSELENIDADTPNLNQSIWNVPDAFVQDSRDARGKKSQLLNALKEKFPSLGATITYKKHVERDRNEADPTFAATRTAEFVSVSQDVCFHDVAIEMLMEIHSGDNGATILSFSQLSLKAVHILAIALRALVVSVLDNWRVPPVSLSVIERAALGAYVTLDDEKKVAVLTERRLKMGTSATLTMHATGISSSPQTLRLPREVRTPRRAQVVHANDDADPVPDVKEDDREDWIHKK